MTAKVHVHSQLQVHMHVHCTRLLHLNPHSGGFSATAHTCSTNLQLTAADGRHVKCIAAAATGSAVATKCYCCTRNLADVSISNTCHCTQIVNKPARTWQTPSASLGALLMLTLV